jgi:hypothetical protein
VTAPVPGSAARRVRCFAGAVEEFFAAFRPEVHRDRWNFDFARAWAGEFLTEGAVRAAVRFELQTSGYRPTPRCLLVTPSNGTTSGIVALLWAYLGSAEVDLLPSASDTWTAGFARLLRSRDGDGAVRVLAKDDVVLGDFVPDHSAVVVYGSDATVEVYRTLLAGTAVPLLGYGSKTSFAVHDRDGWDDGDTDRHFTDLVAADGLGCLNPVVLYVPRITAAVRAGLEALSDRIAEHYRGDAAAAVQQREFRVENVVSGCATGTVGRFAVRDRGPAGSFPATRGYGTCHVVEVDGPQDVVAEWSGVPGWVSSVTLGSPDPAVWVDALTALGPSRITAPGQAQRPPLTWAHDNRRNLLPLVELVDVELAGA